MSDPVLDPAARRGAIDLFLRLRPHLGVVHVVPGRVRLRIGAGALDVVGSQGAAVPSLDQLAPLFAPGTLRLNAAARSVIITHDPAQFPPGFWDDCLNGPEDTARARLEAAFSTPPLETEIVP